MNNIYKLNNGQTAEFIGYNDWDLVLLRITGYEGVFCITNCLIHSMTDYGEPCAPLKNDLQLTDSELYKVKQVHLSSCSF